jgi:hypothetical protein
MKVDYVIKFVDNLYYFYNFILQEREWINNFLKVFVIYYRKICTIIKGMLVKKK